MQEGRGFCNVELRVHEKKPLHITAGTYVNSNEGAVPCTFSPRGRLDCCNDSDDLGMIAVGAMEHATPSYMPQLVKATKTSGSWTATGRWQNTADTGEFSEKQPRSIVQL